MSDEKKESAELTLTLPAWASNTKNALGIITILTVLIAITRSFSATNALHMHSPAVFFLLFLASCFVCYQNLSRDNATYWQLGIPFFLFFTGLFSRFSVRYINSSLGRDYTFFTITTSIFLLGYYLSLEKKIKPSTAIVSCLFLSGMLLHLATAFSHDHLAALDPYWHYKWMQEIVETNQIPEFDNMVYPLTGGLLKNNDPIYVQGKSKRGYGLDNRGAEFLNPLVYSSLALILGDFGISLHDVAMILPGVLAAFSIVIIYLLVSELFFDMQPHNRIAAAFAAFILLFSPAFSAKAVATNCEDDALGMVLMLGGFFLFFSALNRKKYIYAFLSGITFLMLRISWNGWLYALMTLGIYVTLHSVINFINKKNCIVDLPYLAITIFISQLWPIFLHGRGIMPSYSLPPLITLLPLVSAFSIPILLETLRSVKGKNVGKTEMDFESKIEILLNKNIMFLAFFAILCSIIFVNIIGIQQVTGYISYALSGAVDKSVVHDTVAEQNPLVGGAISGEKIKIFVNSSIQRYGLGALYGFLMLPVLTYLALRKNRGALFVLMWSIPMLWGVYNKSAWLFASSAAITVLGSTVGLFAAVNRKQLNSFRVIGTLFLVVLPVSYIPILGSYSYDKSVGHYVMYSGPSRDRYLWQDTLMYHKDDTDKNSAILTWWDYGHWFTSVSHRPVLIDNLQADQFEIQDVARFFVNSTTEEEAFKTVETYQNAYKRLNQSLDYVVIDWTMIGKTSALHYISLGDIEKNIKPDPEVGFRSYGQCKFNPEYSDLEPKIMTVDGGKYQRAWRLFYDCRGQHGVGGLYFTVSEGSENLTVEDVKVILIPNGNQVQWSQYRDARDASILGVYAVDDILACGILFNHPQYGQLCQNLPTLNTFIFVPQEFQDYMMTKLYLGEYAESYERMGLTNTQYIPLKHFKLIKDFSQGYVRSYEISYEGFKTNNLKARESIFGMTFAVKQE